MAVSSRRRVAVAWGVCLTICLGLTNGIDAQDSLRSTWECLPDETAIAVRIPNGLAIAEAIREDTKVGSVLFGDARLDQLRELILETRNPDGDQLADKLAELGLSVEDFPRVLAGESGYAILMSLANDEQRLALGIGWFQPGVDLANRVYESAGIVIEQQEDQQPRVERVDIQLAGYDVMQITSPVTTTEYDEFKYPEDIENLSEEEQDAAWEKAEREWEASAKTVVTYQTIMVSVLDDRLLVCHTLESSNTQQREEVRERLEGTFARLLSAHSDDTAGFASRMALTRGIDSAFQLPGTSALEFMLDPKPLFRALRADEDFKDDPQGEAVLKMIGVDDLGPAASRITLDGNRLRSSFFVSIPAPRRGLLRLLNQDRLESVPPAWVPASAVSYSHFSFDLGAAYRIVREEAINALADEAENAFEVANTQLQNLVQSNLEDLLNSLGRRHSIVYFQPGTTTIDLGDGEEFETPQDRFAVVWEVKDDEVWSRIMKAIGTFAAFADGVQQTQEQGFSGWRMKNEIIEGGLVHGKGYLVLAYGDTVLERVLSSLNDPPDGDAALRESELFERAGQMIELKPASGFEVVDADRYVQMALGMLDTYVEEMEEMFDEFGAEEFEGDPDAQMIKVAKIFLLDQQELKGLMGVSVSEYQVNDDGVHVRSIVELQPPQ